MNIMGNKHLTQILGITLDHGHFEAVLVKRSGGSVEIQKTVSAPLTLDPLRNEIELVGREIRNLLDAGGIREKRCVIGVPVGWALTLHTSLAGIEAADVEGYLQIEAERSLPRNPDELILALSTQKSGQGTPYAMQIGLPRDYVERLSLILEAAQLKPMSFSLGITSLPESIPSGATGRITALVDDSGIELLAACNGGVSSLRTLDGVWDTEGTEKKVQTDQVARELRITLRQMPEELREHFKQLSVTGSGRLPRQVADELQGRSAALGLAVVLDAGGSGALLHGLKVANGVPVTPSVCLAARYLSGSGMGFEFLPPKPSIWQQWSERYSARRLAWAGAGAAAVVLIVGGAFALQQAELGSLRSKWNGMKARVAEVEELQGRVRKFRPWYNESVASLAILKRVTEAFPEEGSVSAKNFEIHNQNVVSVTGTARDHASLLKALDRLRAAQEVGNIQVDQIRGKSPMQFTFNFNWGPGGNQ